MRRLERFSGASFDKHAFNVSPWGIFSAPYPNTRLKVSTTFPLFNWDLICLLAPNFNTKRRRPVKVKFAIRESKCEAKCGTLTHGSIRKRTLFEIWTVHLTSLTSIGSISLREELIGVLSWSGRLMTFLAFLLWFILFHGGRVISPFFLIEIKNHGRPYPFRRHLVASNSSSDIVLYRLLKKADVYYFYPTCSLV